MANKNRHRHQHFLTLTHPQLVALATQKGIAPYRDAIDKTKGQLIALLRDVEGVLTPVKTWPEIDGEARLDNDNDNDNDNDTHTRDMQEVFAKMYGGDDAAPVDDF
jgi:hypothetical protein